LFGWYLGARSKEGIDTAQTGLAKGDYEMIIKIADTIQDKQSIKDKLIPAYRYMMAYSYNVQKDIEKALDYNEKILLIDPQDELALKNKELLTPILKKQKDAAQKNK
jgi:tetratricopeptide (TPR) repeat protein